MPRSPAVRPSFENLEVFCRTVELGSFTAAARALGVTPQAASRAVGRLEVSLGRTLVRRSTRLVRPTDEGRRFHEQCRDALELLDRATAAVAEAPLGVVRISMPSTIAHVRLLPALASLRTDHPSLRIEAHVSSANVDFVREGFDLAVRMGEIDRATYVARNLGTYSLGLFASPGYLARKGTPRSIEDLAEHDAIVFARPSTGRVLPWELAGGRTIAPGSTWVCTEDFLACLTLARAGAGVVQAYHFLVERDLASGVLVEILPKAVASGRRFSLVYPKGGAQTKAARIVVEHILRHVRC